MIDLQSHMIQQSISILNPLLGSLYHLSFKTKIAHWNIQGPLFASLHPLFDEQYKDLIDSIDTVAERIRALGFKVNPTLSQWLQQSIVLDSEELITEQDYLNDLGDDHSRIIVFLRESLNCLTENSDEGTKDLLIQLLRSHEKTLWMLRSHRT